MDEELARDIAFEAQYWKLVLDDLQGVNDMMQSISDETKGLVILALTLVSHTPTASNRIMEAVNGIQLLILKGQANLDNVLKLSQGRHTALRAKLDES